MTCRTWLTFVLLALAACATAPPVDTTGRGAETSPKTAPRPSVTVWSGAQNLDTTFTVPQGTRLEVRPGTVVRMGSAGTIIVMGQAMFEGTPEHPVRIEGAPGASAAAVQVRHPSATVVLRHVEVENTKIGVAATEGSTKASDLRFENNGTGFTVEAAARARITATRFTGNAVGLLAGNGGQLEGADLAFEGNETGLQATRSAKIRLTRGVFTGNKVGYRQQNACDAILDGPRFTRNDRAVALVQTRRSPTIRHATFSDNPVGTAATLFSNPLVEATIFEANGQAFTADQFSVPFLRFNRFEKNEGAVRLDKRSGARIEGNHFKGNDVALFADFSSYPKVTGNRFDDNGWHVKLGIYESADFEARFGSGGVMRGKVQGRNTRNPLLLKDQMPDPGKTFSIAKNAWDEATLREMVAGPDENLSRFWDGRDQGPITYEGFGSESYAVDVIIYAPPLEDSPSVGPEAWVPMPPSPAPAAGSRLRRNPPAGRPPQ